MLFCLDAFRGGVQCVSSGLKEGIPGLQPVFIIIIIAIQGEVIFRKKAIVNGASFYGKVALVLDLEGKQKCNGLAEPSNLFRQKLLQPTRLV